MIDDEIDQGTDASMRDHGGWSKAMSEFEVYEVVLPGRAARIGEPASTDLRYLVRMIAAAVR